MAFLFRDFGMPYYEEITKLKKGAKKEGVKNETN